MKALYQNHHQIGLNLKAEGKKLYNGKFHEADQSKNILGCFMKLIKEKMHWAA